MTSGRPRDAFEAIRRLTHALGDPAVPAPAAYLSTLETIRETFAARFAGIMGIDPATETPAIVAASGSMLPGATGLPAMPGEGSVTATVIRTGSAVLISGYEDGPPLSAEIAEKTGLLSAMMIPIRPLNALLIMSEERNAYDQRDLELAKNVATLLAAMLRLADERELASRERLARELDDDASALVYAALIRLESLSGKLTGPTAARVSRAVDQLWKGLAEIRLASAGTGGSIDSVETRLREIAWLLGANVRIAVEVVGDDLDTAHICAAERIRAAAAGSDIAFVACPHAAECCRELTRIALEATSNAVRHSGTENVHVRFENTRERVTLSITDWGRGFDVEAAERGMGLESMRRRAAAIGWQLEIQSAPGEGTEVRLWCGRHPEAG